MNLNIKLDKNFTTAFNKLSAQYGEEMAYLNGFGDKQLSYTDFIDNFIDKETIADASVDGSANVGQKTMVTLLNEMSKPQQKLLAFNKIFYELNKKFGFKVANEWLESEWTGKSYLHDANTSSFVSYCFSYDLKDLAEKGLFFIDNFNAEPPKHLGTFIDFVKEFVSFAANSTSGAVGLANLIPYMYYFWDRDVKNGYYTESPEKYAKQQIQRFIYAVNQPFLRGSIQSAFTNTSVFDRCYLEALFGGTEFPDGTFMYDELDGIMAFQKLYLETMSEIRSKNMMTYPVNSISLLRKDGKFQDEDFAKWAVRHNMKWCDSNIYIDDSVTSLSNCCRLKNDIKDLYFNSIGGTALKVGSVKVNTINLARIAYDCDKTEENYLELLRQRVILCCECLDVVRNIIKRNVEKGLMKNFSSGMIDFEHLYSTIGVIGVYEALRVFDYTFKDEVGNTYYKPQAYIFGKKIFETIHETKEQWAKAANVDYKFNLEAVPAETAAAKLMKKDLFFYPEETITDLPLYGNQFIPLGIQTTLEERVKIGAAFDSYCNGGSILHVNLDAPIKDFNKMWRLVNYIADSGLTYFAFCVRISACKHNHGFYGNVCPECGCPVETTYQRIVGFLTPVKTYSKERKQEFYKREWHKI